MKMSLATWRQIYSMVDFILEFNPKISPAVLQRRLISSDDYRSWLAKNGLDTIGSSLQNRWLQFVQTKIENEHLPLPLPDQDIFLLCSSDYSDVGALYRYDLATGQANLLLRLERALTAYQPLRFSPGGRWLAVQSLDRTRTCWQLHLLNLHSNQTETFTSVYRFAYPDYDWSANGRWLLRIDRELLYLIAPDHDYQQVIFHGFPNCFFAAWVNKEKIDCK
jgi:Tol biopolymer transport system component